jgi:hypothetical protein
VFEGKGANRRRKGAAHSAVATVAALLLILQSFVAGLAPAHAARLAAAGLAPICAVDEPSDPKSPSRDHARSHCCLPGESCDGSAPPVAFEGDGPQDRSRLLALVSFSRLREAPRRQPAGWASSWSSRAPPAFS